MLIKHVDVIKFFLFNIFLAFLIIFFKTTIFSILLIIICFLFILANLITKNIKRVKFWSLSAISYTLIIFLTIYSINTFAKYKIEEVYKQLSMNKSAYHNFYGFQINCSKTIQKICIMKSIDYKEIIYVEGVFVDKND